MLLLLLPVSLWASADHSITLPRTYAFLAAAALYWIVAALPQRPILRSAGWALLLGGLALSVLVLAATSFPTKIPWVSFDPLGILHTRLQGVLPPLDDFNANTSGGALALFLAPSLALTLAGNRLQRVLAALVAAWLGVLLLFSQSRGAWLGMAAAMPVITVIHNRRWLWLWVGAGMAAVAALVIVGPQQAVNVPLGGSTVSTLVQREELWTRAVYLIHDFPFTGVGLGMPETVIKLLYPPFLNGIDSRWYHVHNSYLQMACEMGIPGLIAFLALLWSLAAALARRARLRPFGRDEALAAGLLGTLVVFMVHGMVDATLASNKILLLFFGFLGLMASVSRQQSASIEHSPR